MRRRSLRCCLPRRKFRRNVRYPHPRGNQLERTPRQKNMPPYALILTSGSAVDFPMAGIQPDWLSKPFTAEILVQFDGIKLDANPNRPFRVMGCLDAEHPNRPRAGWALYLYAATAVKNWEETAAADHQPAHSIDRSVWDVETYRFTKGDDLGTARRLVFAYVAADESLRRLVGPMFEPADMWWEIAVSHRTTDHQIMIVLGKVMYLQRTCQDMLMAPSPPRFSFGANRSVDEDFRGHLAAFQLHQADYPHRDRSPESTRIALDFSMPRNKRVLDLSGWGNHARLPPEASWLVSDRPPSYSSPLVAAPGKTLVAEIGRSRVVELLDTQGLVGLTTPFTAEMWVRETDLSCNKVLLGDAVQEYETGTGGQRVGWSLLLNRGLGAKCRFILEYPADSPSPKQLVSTEFVSTGGWHHVALCNTPTECQVYLDGRPMLASQDSRSAALRKIWVPGPSNLVLGERGSGDGYGYAIIRGFHLSRRLLYQGALDPPPVFKQDQNTLVLLDFSQRAGYFIRDLSNHRGDGLIANRRLEEVEKDW